MSPITLILLKLRFKFFNFLIFDIGNTNTIKKIMIIVNNIFKNIEIAEHLKTLFLTKL